ncbi:MAG: hypothetical protein KAW56_07940 [Candidatus Marinimicrobia bacterium]|nr:hypothetical protein [Candidatus Neomarinimicrobiota bacterium]
MQRAIRKYIKKESEKLDFSSGKDHINQTFDMLDFEIDKVKRREIKRARSKKLKEWKRWGRLNCGHNNKKKRMKGRSKNGRQERRI